MDTTERYEHKKRAKKNEYLKAYHQYRCLGAGLDPNLTEPVDPIAALRNLVTAAEPVSARLSSLVAYLEPKGLTEGGEVEEAETLAAAVAAAKEVLK